MSRTLKLLCAVLLAGAFVLAGSSAGLAKKRPNPPVPVPVTPATACLQDGYLDLYTQTGTRFKNAGKCVKYALGGGELVQLKLTASYPGDNPYEASWQLTIDAFGLAHWDELDPVFSSWWLYLLPGPDTSYSGTSTDGAGPWSIPNIPCSSGFTAAYATGLTHAGYHVTSRTVTVGVGCPDSQP